MLNIFRKLPALPEEFNRNYYIKADTVDGALLRRSGYKMLHRPYFAMKDSTHSVITLNPYKKVCVDAAHVSEEVIDFKAFLKIFDDNK